MSWQSFLKKGYYYYWGVEIYNKSSFDVTIDELGFGSYNKLRSIILKPKVLGSELTLPLRIKSHESKTFICSVDFIPSDSVIKYPKAFAMTGSGKVIYGRSKVFKEFIKNYKNA